MTTAILKPRVMVGRPSWDGKCDGSALCWHFPGQDALVFAYLMEFIDPVPGSDSGVVNFACRRFGVLTTMPASWEWIVTFASGDTYKVLFQIDGRAAGGGLREDIEQYGNSFWTLVHSHQLHRTGEEV